MSNLPEQQEIIYTGSPNAGALRQGEIVTAVVQSVVDVRTLDSGEGPEIDAKTHPYAIVVSQDCDLDWDFKARQGVTSGDKIVPNIFFCEVTTAEALRGRSDIKSDIWRRIAANKDERYHFLQRVNPSEDALGEGLPELGIDFKRFFTIPTDDVYYQLKSTMKRRCRLSSPYLEHFSTRFCYYQFRVALPSDHFSEPVVR